MLLAWEAQMVAQFDKSSEAILDKLGAQEPE